MYSFVMDSQPLLVFDDNKQHKISICISARNKMMALIAKLQSDLHILSKPFFPRLVSSSRAKNARWTASAKSTERA